MDRPLKIQGSEFKFQYMHFNIYLLKKISMTIMYYQKPL